MLNKKQWMGIALAYTLFVFIASLATVNIKVATTIEHKDKLIHICIYIVYTTVWFAYFNSEQIKINFSKAIILAFTTGILIEILQGTCTQTRSADLLDVLANCIGIAIAITLLKQQKIINMLNLKK